MNTNERFSGKWETKRLGELGAFVKGRGIKRDDVTDEGVPCIRYGELYTLHSALVLTHFGIFMTNPCHERIRTG